MSIANINMPGNTLRYYIGKWSLPEAAEMLWYIDSTQSGNGEKRPGVSSARGGFSPVEFFVNLKSTYHLLRYGSRTKKCLVSSVCKFTYAFLGLG